MCVDYELEEISRGAKFTFTTISHRQEYFGFSLVDLPINKQDFSGPAVDQLCSLSGVYNKGRIETALNESNNVMRLTGCLVARQCTPRCTCGDVEVVAQKWPPHFVMRLHSICIVNFSSCLCVFINQTVTSRYLWLLDFMAWRTVTGNQEPSQKTREMAQQRARESAFQT